MQEAKDEQHSLIEILGLDAEDGVGNRTMQDLFEMVYTPKHSNHDSPVRGSRVDVYIEDDGLMYDSHERKYSFNVKKLSR